MHNQNPLNLVTIRLGQYSLPILPPIDLHLSNITLEMLNFLDKSGAIFPGQNQALLDLGSADGLFGLYAGQKGADLVSLAFPNSAQLGIADRNLALHQFSHFKNQVLAKPDSLPPNSFQTIFLSLPTWLGPHNGQHRETPTSEHFARFFQSVWNGLKPNGQLWLMTASWQLSAGISDWLARSFGPQGKEIHQIRQEVGTETQSAELQAWKKAQTDDLQLRVFHLDADGRHFACHRPENGPWFLITTLPSAKGPLPVKLVRQERNWKIFNAQNEMLDEWGLHDRRVPGQSMDEKWYIEYKLWHFQK
ncbi:MAG: hypothetical protein OHK0053_19160 [Microscillaceae bacterium]